MTDYFIDDDNRFGFRLGAGVRHALLRAAARPSRDPGQDAAQDGGHLPERHGAQRARLQRRQGVEGVTSWQIIEGDCRDVLATIDAGSVQTCVTSPPYFGLRDYGHNGQIGLEPTPDEFVAALVDVFREVRRVLKDDGTVWLNLGDSYAGSVQTGGDGSASTLTKGGKSHAQYIDRAAPRVGTGSAKPKDLMGVPWMVAFALRDDGWYLRDEVIWHKPNPMPESVRDRTTKAHERIFLLTKSPRYFYDADAIAEDATNRAPGNVTHKHTEAYEGGDEFSRTKGGLLAVGARETRNKRSVWTIATQPYAGAHFATFPAALVLPCILAGCPEGGTVLDPFNGAGTTGMVALRNNRSYVGIELNPEYAELARNRIRDDAPLLNTIGEAA
jgi:DNA modification methylase